LRNLAIFNGIVSQRARIFLETWETSPRQFYYLPVLIEASDLMTDQPTSNRSVSAFVSFTYFEEGDPANAAVFIFEDDDHGKFMLTTTLEIAAEMQTLLSEAFVQMEKASKGDTAQASPERIESYSAMTSLDDPDEVVILIEGERSDPFLGRMKTNDARSLAALLKVAAERGPKPH
jgi:hypothetical protein